MTKPLIDISAILDGVPNTIVLNEQLQRKLAGGFKVGECCSIMAESTPVSRSVFNQDYAAALDALYPGRQHALDPLLADAPLTCVTGLDRVYFAGRIVDAHTARLVSILRDKLDNANRAHLLGRNVTGKEILWANLEIDSYQPLTSKLSDHFHRIFVRLDARKCKPSFDFKSEQVKPAQVNQRAAQVARQGAMRELASDSCRAQSRPTAASKFLLAITKDKVGR